MLLRPTVWNGFLVYCFACLVLPTVLSAQVTAYPTAAQSDSTSTRDQVYAELAAEVAALERQGNLLKKVVRLVKPAVVHLESIKFEGETAIAGEESFEEAGSGVVILIDGRQFVLTNRHVVRYASLSNITIRLHDGRFLRPTRVWADADTDVAVIGIEPQADLVPARLGDSDKLDIGDFVLAVGSPFGLSHSVSYGIVSAKGRRDLELGTEYVRLQDFLQTDAAINPGNSGGPLLNLRGEVVAINTAIASSSGGNEGVSFSIPINLVMFVAKQLVKTGEVTHAYLGVQLDNSYDLATAKSIGVGFLRGALIKGITPKSPAYFANLRLNDLIVSYAGETVEDDDHLVNLVSLTPINKAVPIEIIRGGQMLKLSVKVGNRKHFPSVGTESHR